MLFRVWEGPKKLAVALSKTFLARSVRYFVFDAQNIKIKEDIDFFSFKVYYTYNIYYLYLGILIKYS